MRILAAHNFYQQSGGEDQSFAAEVAILRENGHEVLEYHAHNDTINQMGKIQAAMRTIWNRGSYRDVRALIRKTRPEVIHFNNTFPLISPAAYYAARAERVPVVQALRNYRLLCPGALLYRDGKVCEECLQKRVPLPGLAHGCYRNSRAASATVLTMLTIHRAAGTWQNAVDLYFSLTAFARDKFIQGGFPADKIVVKPNFVHPDPGIGPGGDFAVFLGRLAPEKGILTMLQAWQSLGSRVPLKIIGDGPMRDEIAARVATMRGVELLGRRPVTEAYEIIGRAAMLIFPSQWYETFGRVAIEAFAKGTPVVASNLGAMAEVVEHGRTGLLFRPGDAADLAASVRRLLDNPIELANMRQWTRMEFDRKYTAKANYRMLCEIYARARQLNAARDGQSSHSAPPIKPRLTIYPISNTRRARPLPIVDAAAPTMQTTK